VQSYRDNDFRKAPRLRDRDGEEVAREALQVPFTASLAFRYRVAANYTAAAHPSLPNYVALTSGRTFGIRDDNYHVLPAGGLGAQLTADGVTWRSYMKA
jgi:hypothetical protein